jgi:hypothetical protein
MPDIVVEASCSGDRCSDCVGRKSAQDKAIEHIDRELIAGTATATMRAVAKPADPSPRIVSSASDLLCS